MTTKSTQPAKTSQPAAQIHPLSSPLSQSFVDSSFRPILMRCKRKLSELSLQNTSIVPNTNKSVFNDARDDIIKINEENQKEVGKDLSPESLAKNCRHRAKVRICGGGKLRHYTKMIIDRKTSTGSNCLQQSMPNGSTLSSSNHVSSSSTNHQTGAEEGLTQRRRKSSFKQILLNPSQLFYRHTVSNGAKWRIQALPMTQNYQTNIDRSKTNQTNAFSRRQLQKTMSVDDDDYEDASIEEGEEDDYEEENTDIGSEEELYWLSNNRESNDAVVGGDDDDDDYDYDEGEAEAEAEVDDGHSGVDVNQEVEARMKGQLSLIPMNFVSSMKMMRRLTVSSPRHQASFISHR